MEFESRGGIVFVEQFGIYVKFFHALFMENCCF